MQTILITGINGFIGSHLAEFYYVMDYQVIGIDITDNKNQNAHVFYKIDLLKDNIEEILLLVKPDIIIHCAGLADVGFSVKHPQIDYELNVTVVHNILFAMKKVDCLNIKFILMSSAAVYGQPLSLPICETQTKNPLSPYALHKGMAEDICLYFNEIYGTPMKILRIFSAYGPGLKKQIFWDMNEKLKKTGKLCMLGTGRESRDYIYISDLIQVVDLIIKDTGNKVIYNVGNGVEFSVSEVASLYLQAIGSESSLLSFNQSVREGDPLYWRADISELEKLGYKERISIKEGISRYIDWVHQIKE